MSVKIMSRVWEHSQASGSDLLLLLALADNADDGGYCWPGIEYLAAKIRMTERSVINITRRLEQAGELLVSRSRRHGNRYLVLAGMSDSERADGMLKLGISESLICETGFTSEVKDLHFRSETCFTSEVKQVSQEPSINHQLTVNETSHGDADVAAPAAAPVVLPVEKKPATQDALRKALELKFCELTNIPRPKTETESQKKSAGSLWFAPLREIAELAAWNEHDALSLLEASVKHLRGRVIISNPNSLLKTARAIAAGTAPGATWKRETPPAPKRITVKTVNPVTGEIEEMEVNA